MKKFDILVPLIYLIINNAINLIARNNVRVEILIYCINYVTNDLK